MKTASILISLVAAGIGFGAGASAQEQVEPTAARIAPACGGCGAVPRTVDGRDARIDTCQQRRPQRGLGQGQGRGQRAGRGCGRGQGKGKGKGKGPARGRRDPGNRGQASPGQDQGRRVSNSTCCGGCAGSAVSAAPTVSLDYLRRLQATLEEELFARDFYAAAARATGMQRHRNLARAEEHHAQAIATAIESLGGQAVREHGRELPDGSDPAQADRVSREIEQRVIEVYTGLIEDCPDPDLLPILRNIQAANHRHLQAVGG